MAGTVERAGVLRLTRRMFVRTGVAAGALMLAPNAWAKAASVSAYNPLVRSRFKPLIGAKLRMADARTEVHVVLAGIGDLLPVLRRDDPNRFSLLFDVPGDDRCTGGIKTFHHRDLGQVDLFVSPVDRSLKTRHYEAVINRSHS